MVVITEGVLRMNYSGKLFLFTNAVATPKDGESECVRENVIQNPTTPSLKSHLHGDLPPSQIQTWEQNKAAN